MNYLVCSFVKLQCYNIFTYSQYSVLRTSVYEQLIIVRRCNYDNIICRSFMGAPSSPSNRSRES